MIFLIAARAVSVLEVFILAWALMSWFHPDPRNPLVRIIHMVVDPIMKPFEALIPPLGGISFAGLAAMAVLEYLVKPILLRAAGVMAP